MFSFFDKKQPTPQPGRGTFTAYDIEYVYDYLGKERIDNRIAELQDKATMGLPFKEFVEREVGFGNRGVLFVFSLILGYFDNHFDLAIFLFEKSKFYNENNYHDTPNAKKIFEKNIATIRSLIERRPENEDQFKSKLQSGYWIDYHYFYSLILEILKHSIRDASRLQKELNIDFAGSYVVNKDKISKGGFVLEIKVRRKPKTGKYILLREEGIYYDLKEMAPAIYEFYSAGRKYEVIMKNENCEIIKINPDGIVEGSLKLNSSADTKKIINELIENYIPNYNDITIQMGVHFGWERPVSNGFIFDVIDFYNSEGNIEGVKLLTEIGLSIPDTWSINYLHILEAGDDSEDE